MVNFKVVPREEWLNTVKPRQEFDVLMFNSSFIREIPKFLQRNFILMIPLNRGWFVVFLNASHLHAKFQSYDYMMDLGKGNHVMSVDSQTSFVGVEVNAHATGNQRLVVLRQW